MPAERYYIGTPLEMDAALALEGQEFHHLAHVMRAKENETIEVVNGLGTLAEATIERLEKKRALLRVHSIRNTSAPDFEVILAQAIPRLNRLDFIVEKGTELGMTQLWLYPGVLSERKSLTEHQLERLQAVAIAAMKQCGSLHLPKIASKSALEAWTAQDFPLFFGDTAPEAPLFKKQWKGDPQGKGIIFVVGPESGLTIPEMEHLRQMGGIGVKLHRHILRTDTAALAALTLINHSSSFFL